MKEVEHTNVMRLLTQAGIAYEARAYPVDESDLSGVHAAHMLGLDPDCVFKTLVARGDRQGICVFVIPVAEELDGKRCAAATGDRKIEMVAVKELPTLTGYIRGGCSPVGMKKKYPTYIDEIAELWDTIYVSAGKRGIMVGLSPSALQSFVQATYAPLTRMTALHS